LKGLSLAKTLKIRPSQSSFLLGINSTPLALGLLFLVCFGVYLFTLCPSFLDDDSPETIAAGVTLGIQHPPGYPLDTLCVRLVSFLPLGGMAFRVNLFSALLASLTVLLLSINILLTLESFFPDLPGGARSKPRLTRLLCALTGGLLLAASYTFWEKALGAKGGIYLLQQLLLQGLFLCFLFHRREKNQDRQAPSRWLYLAFFLFGLGCANHWETQVLFLPALALFFLRTQPGQKPWRPFPARVWTWAVGFFFLGASPLLYLPLRAHLHPAWNLGDPETLSLFKASILRHYYSYREPGLLGALGRILSGQGNWGELGALARRILDLQGPALGEHLVRDMGWPALVLACLSLLGLGPASVKKVFLFVLAPMALLFLVLFTSIWVPVNMPYHWLLDNYLLPANWIVAFLASLGLYTTARYSWRAFAWLALPVVLLFLGFTLGDRFPTLNQQYQMIRYDYGANLLKSTPPKSILTAEGDEDNFPLFYFQGVENKRLDIRVIPSFTLFESWGVEQVERLHPELGLTASSKAFPDPWARMSGAAAEIVAKNRGKSPIAYSRFNGAFHRYYLSLHPELRAWTSGIAYLLDSPPARAGASLPPNGLRLRHLADCPSNNHPSLRSICLLYQGMGLGSPPNPQE
jgi:hypothetical protein